VVTPWRRIPLEAPTPLTEVARNGGAIWLSTTEEFQARYPDVPVVVDHQAHVAIGLVVEGRPAGALGISRARRPGRPGNALRTREQASYLAEVSAMLASTTDLQSVLEQLA